MRFSIVIPVFNRPQELDELLNSLTRQTFRDFEVVVVDDGSSLRCEEVAERYLSALELYYYYKTNSGPGLTRNFGAAKSSGEYLVFLDSDCIVPDGYVKAMNDALADNPADLYGGPDRAHPSFNATQKAINYSMTSFFTTGGIRGGKKSADKFYPRTFNMGVRRDMFEKVGGFTDMRFGEDVDFSYRVIEAGGTSRLFSDAWVWHKRRSNFRQFYKQVFNSGIVRIHLSLRHPGSLKMVHFLPATFTLGVILILIASLYYYELLFILAAFMLLICTDSAVRNRSIRVGFLSIWATFVQLFGYGFGFLVGWWNISVMGNTKYAAFNDTFYS